MAKKALTIFLGEILDYAGLFPPAQLSLPDSIGDYARWSNSEFQPMLSCYIIPYPKFEPLSGWLRTNQLDFNGPLRFSVTAAPATSANHYIQTLGEIKKAVLGFHENYAGEAETHLLEIRLPEEALNNPGEIERLLAKTSEEFESAPRLPKQFFFEVPGFSFNVDITRKVVESVAKFNKENDMDCGFKIRCGGVEEHMFPPAGYLAQAMIAARENQLPLKFTAGLHHPIRMFHPSVQTKMFGFMNVFGAGVLGSIHRLPEEIMIWILNDEQISHFSFTDNHFSWKDLKATVPEIKKVRAEKIRSFGSCSISEPVEDLQQLGFL